jgi:hypothetical protein
VVILFFIQFDALLVSRVLESATRVFSRLDTNLTEKFWRFREQKFAKVLALSGPKFTPNHASAPALHPP